MGGKWRICVLPLAGGKAHQVVPPGFGDCHVAHATAAKNGYIAFDSRTYVAAR